MKIRKKAQEIDIVSRNLVRLVLISLFSFSFLFTALFSQENSPNWEIVDIAAVLTTVDLAVVRDSNGNYHLAWQEGVEIKYARSIDNCATWTAPVIIRTGVVKWLGIFIDNDDMLHIGYAVHGNIWSDPFYTYHFSSNDGGDTWSQNHVVQYTDDYYTQIGGHAGMSVSPDGTIFWGGDKAYNNQFHSKISTDKGLTWSELRSSQSMPDRYGGRVIDLVFDSNNNIHVLTWTWSTSGGQNPRIWYIKSTDVGLTWSTPIFICNYDISKLPHIIVEPINSDILYIFAGNGSKQSINNGESWFSWNGIPDGLPLIEYNSGKFHIRYLNNGNYYYKISGDEGVTWSSEIQVTNSPTVASMGLIGPTGGFYPYYYGKNDDSMDFIPFWVDTEPSTYYIRCAIPNQPPVADAGYDQTVECTSSEGTTVMLDGAASFDPDEDEITYNWTAPGIIFDNPHSPTPTGTFPLGNTTVTLVVNDAQLVSEPDFVDILVVDTTPPELIVAVLPNKLWPPNHKMVDVEAFIEVNDLCDHNPSVVLESIISNEPDDAPGGGDGKTVNDIQGADFGIDDREFQLRAERDGSGDGRIYTITFTASDAFGNSNTSISEVIVNHDRGKLRKDLTFSNDLSFLKTFALFQNYPNPFNPITNIAFALPKQSHVRLQIFNLKGKLVRTLLDTEQEQGWHSVQWNGTDEEQNKVATGIYIYKLTTGQEVLHRRLVLMK